MNQNVRLIEFSFNKSVYSICLRNNTVKLRKLHFIRYQINLCAVEWTNVKFHQRLCPILHYYTYEHTPSSFPIQAFCRVPQFNNRAHAVSVCSDASEPNTRLAGGSFARPTRSLRNAWWKKVRRTQSRNWSTNRLFFVVFLYIYNQRGLLFFINLVSLIINNSFMLKTFPKIDSS